MSLISLTVLAGILVAAALASPGLAKAQRGNNPLLHNSSSISQDIEQK